LYDSISTTVLDLLEAEASALEELMRRLRPTAIAGGRSLKTRALEIIIADVGAMAQDTHKDWVLTGQLQAQLYVTGASSATQLQRFEGDGIQQQRERYRELHGTEPGTGWDGKANFLGELAAICAADETELSSWPLTKGAVPAGQWQAIGELGATHSGPATDTVRVILVTVLTYGDDFNWSPLQLHLVPAALQLGDARALVTATAVRQCATTYLRDRSVSDVRAYAAYVAAGAPGPPPQMPEMYSWLCDVLRPHATEYKVHEWDLLRCHAFCAFVHWHAGEYCDQPAFDLQAHAERAEECGAGSVGYTCPCDTRGWRRWEPAHDGHTVARPEPAALVDAEATDGSEGGEGDDGSDGAGAGAEEDGAVIVSEEDADGLEEAPSTGGHGDGSEVQAG